MKRLTISEAETLADKFRIDAGLNLSESIDIKSLLRKLGITTMFRPLSENSDGISCKSRSGKRFILVNSNATRGRQHFTIAHEIYHLYYDNNPTPHMCGGKAEGEEKNANLFAGALLLPRSGVISMLSVEEIKGKKVELATILRIEQYFGVSRINLLIRLKDLGLINESQLKQYRLIPVKESAKEYGYDLSLYEPGNNNLLIGDFGEKARLLYEAGKISEGHYQEFLNMITTSPQ